VASEVLAAAIVARPAIVALRVLLRRIVGRSEILRRRCIRFWLALLEFIVRLDVAVGMTTFGGAFVAGLGDIAKVVVLVVIVMLVMFAGMLHFAVLIGMRLGVSFVVAFGVMLFTLVQFRGAALADCLAGQNFGSHSCGRLRRGVAMRIAVPMSVVVIFKIFENVADVQEGISVEADIDEGGLHTRKDAGDAAFVDATDQREFLFALDINFD
jgi:hypothetical protein